MALFQDLLKKHFPAYSEEKEFSIKDAIISEKCNLTEDQKNLIVTMLIIRTKDSNVLKIRKLLEIAIENIRKELKFH